MAKGGSWFDLNAGKRHTDAEERTDAGNGRAVLVGQETLWDREGRDRQL